MACDKCGAKRDLVCGVCEPIARDAKRWRELVTMAAKLRGAKAHVDGLEDAIERILREVP